MFVGVWATVNTTFWEKLTIYFSVLLINKALFYLVLLLWVAY